VGKDKYSDSWYHQYIVMEVNMNIIFSTCWFRESLQRARVLIGVCFTLLIVSIPIFSQTSHDIQVAITTAENSIGKSMPSYSFPTEMDAYEYPASSQVWTEVLSGKTGYQYMFIGSSDDTNIVSFVIYIVAGPAETIHETRDTVANILNTMFKGDFKSALNRLQKSESNSNKIESSMNSLKYTIEPDKHWRDGKYEIFLNDIAANGPGYYISMQITKESEE
jgi:hypothetical protein